MMKGTEVHTNTFQNRHTKKMNQKPLFIGKPQEHWCVVISPTTQIIIFIHNSTNTFHLYITTSNHTYQNTTIFSESTETTVQTLAKQKGTNGRWIKVEAMSQIETVKNKNRSDQIEREEKGTNGTELERG